MLTEELKKEWPAVTCMVFPSVLFSKADTSDTLVTLLVGKLFNMND